LDVGQKVTYFELPDQLEYPWSLSGQLELGPVMLVFYRGDWDPFCNGQLAVYARNFEEFERRGVQLTGISVDPPPNNARMVGKLQLPFPLLSDPEGELARLCGLWDDDREVAVPSVLVVDQSAEVRYLHAGKDTADRPADEDLFSALGGLESGIERITGGPGLTIGAFQARQNSVRPDRRALELEELISYYRGALFTTEVLKERLGELGRSGKRSIGEIDTYQHTVRSYMKALDETVELGG